VFLSKTGWVRSLIAVSCSNERFPYLCLNCNRSEDSLASPPMPRAIGTFWVFFLPRMPSTTPHLLSRAKCSGGSRLGGKDNLPPAVIYRAINKSAPIGSCAASFVRLSPLGVTPGLKWPSISKFNAYMLDGPGKAGGKPRTHGISNCEISTLSEGYIIALHSYGRIGRR
jgi:hypothetical protein